MPTDAVLKRNIKFLYALDFFTNSAFTLPIYILFGKEFLHLSYLAAGSLFIVSWFVSIALDFLGGGMADKIGRKQTFLYGMTLQIVTYIPFLLTKSYGLLLVACVINGIGIALTSNSIDALIYEQAASMGVTNTYQQAVATAQMYVFAGRIYASVLGGLAYKVHPRLPYLLYIIVLVLGLVAGAFIKVEAEVASTELPKYSEIMRTAVSVYKTSAALIKFVVIGGLFALWADMLFGYYQPFFIQQHVSSLALGIVFSAISAGSAFGSYLMRKLPDKISPHQIQTLELLGIITSSLLLIVLKIPLAYAAPMFMGIISGFMFPNMRLYINTHVANKVRASALSLATTIFSIGTGIGFIITFYMADHLAAHTVLTTILIGATITILANMGVKMPLKPT